MLIKIGNKKLLPLKNLREAVLMLTYEPHKIKEGMAETIEYNIEEWLNYLTELEKDMGIDPNKMNVFEEQKRQLAGIVGHYKRNQQGRYQRRIWLCKHFGIPWQHFHQPRPGIIGNI